MQRNHSSAAPASVAGKERGTIKNMILLLPRQRMERVVPGAAALTVNITTDAAAAASDNTKKGEWMAARTHKTLSERLLNYPQVAPQDTIELINTDVEALLSLGLEGAEKDAVLEHRRDVLDAIFSYEKKPITSPEVALDLLSGKRPLIRPLARKWLFYVLNERRERKLVPHPNGEDMSYQSVVTRKVPTADKLSKGAPLPRGGKYLGIYGGSPEILSVSTVAQEVALLLETLPVADLLFWHLETGKPPALYSLTKGQGDRGGDLVAFPDLKALEIARKPLEKVRNS